MGKLYQCPECGLRYVDAATAKKCQAWCRAYHGCNIEITKLAVQDNPKQHEVTQIRHDLARASLWTWFLLWGIPIGLIIFSSFTFNDHSLPDVTRGSLLIVATLWFGIACFVNGRRSGRTHCRTDGILMPLLALVGIANLLGAVSFDWGIFTIAFWVTLVLSFVPEYAGVEYLKIK